MTIPTRLSQQQVRQRICLHVAIGGDDRNPGTRDHPFATLEGARNEIRRLKRTWTKSKPVRILVHGGTYHRTRSFALRRSDSGAGDAPIIYQPYDDNPVVLSGAQPLKGEAFKCVSDEGILKRVISQDARKTLLQIALKGHRSRNLGRLRRRGFAIPVPLPPAELFINGERMQRVRWPKLGTIRAAGTVRQGTRRCMGLTVTPIGSLSKLSRWLKSRSIFVGKGDVISCDIPRMRLWHEPSRIWVDGTLSKDWAWTYNRIARIDLRKGRVFLEDAEPYDLPKDGGGEFYFDNVFEELAEPGEYYLDTSRAILYLVPPEDLESSKASISLSTLAEPMLSLRNVSFVSFSRFVLEGGRDLAVSCNGGQETRIQNCEIRNFGRGAIVLNGDNHEITSCHIHNIGGTAIRLAGGDTRRLRSGSSSVRNSHIHHWGYWQKVYAPAVDLDGVGNQVVHCLVHDGPHMAIGISGSDHLIAYNEIRDVVKDFQDAGAVYLNLGKTPLFRGTLICRNFLHHLGQQRSGVYGVYLDNATMDVTLEGNVFFHIGSLRCPDSKAIGGNGFSNVMVRSNMFLDCTIPFELSFYLNGWGRGNLPGLERAWRKQLRMLGSTDNVHVRKHPELRRFFEEDRVLPDTNVFQNNIISNTRVPKIHAGPLRTIFGPIEKVQARDNRIVTGATEVVIDRELDGSFCLNPSSSQKFAGFSWISLKQMGPQHPIGPAGMARILKGSSPQESQDRRNSPRPTFS